MIAVGQDAWGRTGANYEAFRWRIDMPAGGSKTPGMRQWPFMGAQSIEMTGSLAEAEARFKRETDPAQFLPYEGDSILWLWDGDAQKWREVLRRTFASTFASTESGSDGWGRPHHQLGQDAVTDAQAQLAAAASPAVQAAGAQVTQAAQGAVGQGAAAANSALQGMGVPPDVANAVSSGLSQAGTKGFNAAMKAIGSVPGKVFGGLFHHHKHVKNIPQVAAAKAALPAAEQAGFDQATAVVNKTMQAAASAPAGSAAAKAPAAAATAAAAPANATPQAKADALTRAPDKTPVAPHTEKALGGGAAAALMGLALGVPILGAAVAGAAVALGLHYGLKPKDIV
jgi:hypothetical protein